jgi:sporulation protein YlmC with PRC-barrel domain
MTISHAELVYLRRSGFEIAPATDDLTGMVVVDPSGLRIGEVGDMVIDVEARRARLILAVSGGILGFATSEILVPVETVTKVDDRVHVDRSYNDMQAGSVLAGTERPFAEAYEAYGIVPSWDGHGAEDARAPLARTM